MTEKLNNLLHELETAAANYVVAYNNRQPKAERDQLKKEVTAKTEAFNREYEAQTYREWAESGEPVKRCISERFIRGGKHVQFKETDEGVMVAAIKDAEFKASLPTMQKVLGPDVFSNPAWFPMVEKLAWIMAANLNRHLNDNPAFAYAASDAAKAFNFPKDIKSDTDGAVYIALQMVIDAILLIPDERSKKATKPNVMALELKKDVYGNTYCPQWVTIRESLTRQGKKINQVVIGNTGKMAELVTDVMHGLLTHGDFTLACDE